MASALELAAKALAGAAADEEEPEKPWIKEPEKFVDAHECLKLRFVGSAAELRGDKTYTPQYVHQIFENEALELPPASRPLNMEVLYSAASLELWLRCADGAEPQVCCLPCTHPAPVPAHVANPLSSPARQGDAAMDALYALSAQLPAPCASLDEFVQRAEAPFDPVATCGALLETYTLPGGGGACGVHCGAIEGDAARRGFAERVQSMFRWYI